jgi:hydroxyacylglutathione hydrolase
MATVIPIPAFNDNYIWLIRRNDMAAIVDPGEAAPVLKVLRAESLRLEAILTTHHHWDHVNGIEELVRRHPVPVYGPINETVPFRTVGLGEGDEVDLPELALRFRVLDVPGHTAGAIAYHGEGCLFSGDTLFTAGCGRLFEGTARQMYDSLTKLASLDPATPLYCGHEYTVSNLRFAATVEPDNEKVQTRLKETCALRERNLPTVPATLAIERETNPFLRCDLPPLRAAAERHAGRLLRPGAEVLALIRAWKDGF